MKASKWAIATFDDERFYVRERGTLEIHEFAHREEAEAFMEEQDE